MNAPLIVVLLGCLLMSACTRDEDLAPAKGAALFALEVPIGWPAPPLREDNALTLASVQLGKALFFDERLSLGRGLSCASCHHPGRAFSDTVALSLGTHGVPGQSNAPTLANVAYHPLLHRDGGAPTLEQQVFTPLFAEEELDSDPQLVVELLQQDPALEAMSQAAYGRSLDLYVLTRSIANYQRTLLSGHSRYDRFLSGDSSAMSLPEQRGLAVFNGIGNCTACHGGFDLSDHDFHNVGYPGAANDPGRWRITQDPSDQGKFKTPTLRNIALTAPYMHDGSLATLQEVIDHFDTGGQAVANKDPLMQALELTESQKQDLLAFLHALTDERSLDQVP